MDIERLTRVVQVAFEECDLPLLNTKISDVAGPGGVTTVISFCSIQTTERALYVTVYFPQIDPCKDEEDDLGWNGLVQVTTYNTVTMHPITRLIDALQDLKNMMVVHDTD